MQIEEPGVEAKYERQFLVGKGSFGDVYKGVRLSDGVVVAIKEVKRSSIRDQQLLQKSIMRECSINELLGKLNCPYFVEFLDYFESNESVFFIYEFCQGQTLLALMTGKSHQQKENFLVLAMHQILMVLQLLKKHHLLHRDIKSENVLISKGVAKIADFGLARELTEDPMTRGTGSSLTTAPEVYGQSYSYECDIWSLAVTVHRCLFSTYPFDQELLELVDEAQIKRRISRSQFKVVLNEGSKLSALLRKMLVIEPKQRITIEQILSEHPFRLEFSNFKSNNACLRNCLLMISRLHFSGLSGATSNRTYIVGMTAFVAFSESIMIYKECKFGKIMRVEGAASRMLVSLLLLLLALELNSVEELKPLLQYMHTKHTVFSKELNLQLRATNPSKVAALSQVESEIRKNSVLPRIQQLLQLSEGDTTLREILNRNQRFQECIKNIDAGKVKFVYKFYYEETVQFHRAIELI